MSNYAAGHLAEKRAADYLKSKGYKIRGINWKTKYCEIDIVAEKNNCIYFVEVKYRQNSSQGSGLDYITHRKLSQMRFAADMWVQSYDWNGGYQLSAISIDSEQFTFIEEI